MKRWRVRGQYDEEEVEGRIKEEKEERGEVGRGGGFTFDY